MDAQQSANWTFYVVPFLALYFVWKSYDSLLPKTLWTGTIVMGYLLLPVVGAAALSFVVFLIHLFIYSFSIFEDEGRKKNCRRKLCPPSWMSKKRTFIRQVLYNKRMRRTRQSGATGARRQTPD